MTRGDGSYEPDARIGGVRPESTLKMTSCTDPETSKSGSGPSQK